jgi:hypothetical protein
LIDSFDEEENGEMSAAKTTFNGKDELLVPKTEK